MHQRLYFCPTLLLAKDMDCVVGELTAEELGLAEGGAPRLPVLAASHAAIQRACSQEVSDTFLTHPPSPGL